MAILQGGTKTWTTSTYTNGGGACVQVKSPTESTLAVRDSKVPDGPRLAFPPDAWNAFVASVKA
ncbi:DUF397 domain-containing protein [Streptomyces sp. NBC_01275]|uniref:DUF397 domain-containing protein n=1 Tax=Streptomyces sp. NBC_01275 TaxID=2903807 RepID=UPI0022567B61|nr:DUF397 domain-containing protein [Streptomyces sp. NBC_01275]MCX4762904.1 DUF397 domain-containing protein [Streptomyces sp. NBC_01275]